MKRILSLVLLVNFSMSNAWTQCESQTIAHGNGGGFQQFGADLEIAGNFLVVGAPLGDGVVPDSGLAYVFARVADEWVQTQVLMAPDGADNDDFGRTVAIADGVLAVGAPRRDDLGDESGAVYIWELRRCLLRHSGVPLVLLPSAC